MTKKYLTSGRFHPFCLRVLSSANKLWICSTWMYTMSQNPAKSSDVGTNGSSSGFDFWKLKKKRKINREKKLSKEKRGEKKIPFHRIQCTERTNEASLEFVKLNFCFSAHFPFLSNTKKNWNTYKIVCKMINWLDAISTFLHYFPP